MNNHYYNQLCDCDIPTLRGRGGETMIALLPVHKGVAAVRAERIVGVRREQRRLLVWVDIAGSLELYTLVAEEDAIQRAWNEFVEHHDTPSYVWDLTSFSVWDWTSWSESPAPEAVATGD